jgi:hypothetical protein
LNNAVGVGVEDEENEWKEIILLNENKNNNDSNNDSNSNSNNEDGMAQDNEAEQKMIFSWPDNNCVTSEWYGITMLKEGKIIIVMPVAAAALLPGTPALRGNR